MLRHAKIDVDCSLLAPRGNEQSEESDVPNYSQKNLFDRVGCGVG
jgi:hypothetical protein